MSLGHIYSLSTIIGVWILSIAIVIPVAVTGVHTDYCYCQINNSEFFSIWSSVMAFLVPLSLIIFRFFILFKTHLSLLGWALFLKK